MIYKRVLRKVRCGIVLAIFLSPFFTPSNFPKPEEIQSVHRVGPQPMPLRVPGHRALTQPCRALSSGEGNGDTQTLLDTKQTATNSRKLPVLT